MALILLCSGMNSSFGIFAQSPDNLIKKGQIGITFSSLGSNDVINFEQPISGPVYEPGNFYSIGLTYLYPISKKLEIETGIEYSKHVINVYYYSDNPWSEPPNPISAKLSIIDIPIALRYNVCRYFFINGGALIDINIGNNSEVSNQNGIGTMLGFGLNYSHKSGASVFLNPYVKGHSLISFSCSRYPERLMESGIRFGLMYRLK